MKALHADIADIHAITATGAGGVSISLWQSFKSLLAKVSGGVHISDTVANLQSDLAYLNANAATIGSIALTGGPLSAVTVANFKADAAVYDKVVGGVDVSDTPQM